MNPPDANTGLCPACRHARGVQTPRSRFWLCTRAFTDERYVRYPRLPVLECAGFEAATEGPRPDAKAPPEP